MIVPPDLPIGSRRVKRRGNIKGFAHRALRRYSTINSIGSSGRCSSSSTSMSFTYLSANGDASLHLKRQTQRRTVLRRYARPLQVLVRANLLCRFARHESRSQDKGSGLESFCRRRICQLRGLHEYLGVPGRKAACLRTPIAISALMKRELFTLDTPVRRSPRTEQDERIRSRIKRRFCLLALARQRSAT